MKEINIALVAHDGRKKELIDWVKFNWKMLAKYNIWATGTTGRLISELVIEEEGKLIRPFEKKVTRLFSGPLGGDQQIGAMIAEQKINMLKPLAMEKFPLTLEEIFIYEMEAKGYDYQNIFA